MQRPKLEFEQTSPAGKTGDTAADQPTVKTSSAPTGDRRSASHESSHTQRSTVNAPDGGVDRRSDERRPKAAASGVSPDQAHLRLASALEHARSQLLNQTPRSRLLSYYETARDVAILADAPDRVFERLVVAGGGFFFQPSLDAVAGANAQIAEPGGDGPEQGAALTASHRDDGSVHDPPTPEGTPAQPPEPASVPGPEAPPVTTPTPFQVDSRDPSDVSYVLGPDGTLTPVVDTNPSPDPTLSTEPEDTASTVPSEPLADSVAEAPSVVEGSAAPGVVTAPADLVSRSEVHQSEAEPDSPDQPVATGSPEKTGDGHVLLELPQRSVTPDQQPVPDDHLGTPFSEEQLERRLQRLHREQQSVVEEVGVNRLHLVFGFLRWRDGSDSQTSHVAPLILLPVRLEKVPVEEGDAYELTYHGEAVDTNYALSERLSHGLAITLPSFLEQQSPEAYWKEVEASVIDHVTEGWEVVPELALGMFPVDGQSLWLDLEPSHWPTETPLLDRPIVRRVLLGPSDTDEPPAELTRTYDVEAGQAVDNGPEFSLVCDADVFQLAALVDAFGQKEGLVVEGPPGTGKSQTITNLIAAALDKGMSVLFVAQKTASLEVVQRRLGEAGLRDFCVNLHGLKAGSQALLQSIRERIDYKAAPPTGFEQRRQEIQRAREELVAVSTTLSEPVGPESLPLHDVVWRAEGLRGGLPDDFSPVLAPRVEALDLPTFRKLNGFFEELGKVWSALPKQAVKAWYGFVPTRYEDSRRADIEASLRETLAAIDETSTWLASQDVSPIASELRDTRRLVQLGSTDLASTLPPLPAGTTAALAHKLIHSGQFSELQELLTKLAEYKKAVGAVDRVFDYQAKEAESHAQSLHTQAGLLIGKLCGESVLLVDLLKEVEQLNGVIEALESLPKLSEPMLKLLSRAASKLDDFAMVAEKAEKLSAGPGELWLHANPAHAKPIAAEHFNSAIEERDNLKRFAEAALGVFALEKTPDPQALKWAYHTVQQGKSRFGPKGAEYKRAEELIRSTLKKGGYFSNKPKFLKSLESFIQYCEWCQQFEQSEFYRQSFGFLFKGMDSNWGAMERLVSFSQKLRQQLGGAEAERILSDWEGHTRAVGRARSALTEAIDRIRQYGSSHDLAKTVWQQPVTEMAETLRQWATQATAAVDAIRQPWCNGRVTLAEARDALNGYKRAKSHELRVQSHPAFQTLLAPYWKGAATEVDRLEAARAWVDAGLKVEGVDLKLLRWLVPSADGLAQERWNTLAEQAGRFRKALNQQYAKLKRSGEVKLRYWLGVEDSSLDGFKQKLNACIETRDALPGMARWRFLHRELCQQGFERLVQAITSGRLAADHSARAFEYCVYATLLEQKIDRNPLLASFTPANYEELRERFAHLDRQTLVDSGRLTASKLSRVPVPEGVGHGPVNTFSEKALLDHELAKTSHQIPVRQLLSRAPNAVKALKPCFMMSPFAVAQCLPPGQLDFDLVILDEASQLRPETVLGAVARSRKVVVFGDPKQFFPGHALARAASEPAGQDLEETDAKTSMLAECMQHFPRRRLPRHYRSRRETLIQFSNNQFYGGALVVPPSPGRADEDQGVHATLVEAGRYRNGRNEKEAAIVVNRIVSHYRQQPESSLGVVTFSNRQAEEIRRMLARRCSEEPDIDRLLKQTQSVEPLFIKSADAAQGDERDVVLVSTGYVPEEVDGALSLDFGTAGGDLGWRRVNVAATIARRHVELISCLKPSDLPDPKQAEPGVRALRGYLDYALAGHVRQSGAGGDRVPMSYVETALAEVVEELGYRVVPKAGNNGFTVDLAVVHPDRPDEYLLGIEWDGADYHTGMSLRERERARRDLLEARGWALHRIWSVRWHFGREEEISRLKQAIEASSAAVHARTGSESGAHPTAAGALAEADVSRLARDERQEKRLLNEALDRFWIKNIKPHFPVRESSILGPDIVQHLLAAMPATPSEWEAAVPATLREAVNSRETMLLPHVLSVITDYV